MTERNDRILDWVLRNIRTNYAQDVALLVVYGSFLTGHTDEWSDIDFFFVPDTARAFELTRSFIIEGIGFDLFPISWKRLERIAAFQETLTPLIDNSGIYYARAAEDEQHFKTIKDRLRINLGNHDFMHRRAQEEMDKLLLLNASLQQSSNIADCRLFAGKIIISLADIIAWENGVYLKNGLKTIREDLEHMHKIPDGFSADICSIITENDIEQVRNKCDKLLHTVTQTFGYQVAERERDSGESTPIVPAQDINYEELAGWYREVISTFNKVYKYCRNGDVFGSFIAAVSLHQTVNEDTQGLHYDVLSAFDTADLSRLEQQTNRIEEDIVSLLEKHVIVRRYDSFSEFLQENPV